MEDLISIIMPMYNSAEYLEDCIASVLAQSYECFELLLVDDGSTDNTRKICEKLCRQDSRIRLICQSHKGVSAARNTGMKTAKGKFLFFIDSDDVVHPQLLEALHRQLEEQKTTIISTNCAYIGAGHFRIPESREPSGNGAQDQYYLDGEEVIRRFCALGRCEIIFMMGGKMIRSEAVERMRFVERLTHGEDTLFLYQLFSKEPGVTIFCHDWYYYRRHEGSVSKQFSVPICKNRYSVYRYIRKREQQRGKTFNAEQMEIHILEVMIQWYMIAHSMGDTELIQYMKKLASTERRNSFYKRNNWLVKLRFFLAFHCYPVYRLLRQLYIWYYRVFGPGADERDLP